LDQVRNRRRKGRHDELKKWDYSRIEDAEKYLRKIGAYHWFRTEIEYEKADYIVKRDAINLPFFSLKLHDIKLMDNDEVFDFGVIVYHYLNVSGIAVRNCMPSRMTMAYPMETQSSKAAAMSGVRINGGAFHHNNLDGHRQTLKKYGMHEFGYDEIRSGTSAEPLEALIFMGPIFVQALKHHVRDKIQARGTGPVNPATRQSTRGRSQRGGLRLNVGPQSNVKVRLVFGHRRRHIQIQGTSLLIN
jgi:hypothetical protein